MAVAAAVLALSGPARDVVSSEEPPAKTAIANHVPGEVGGHCGRPGGLGEIRERVAAQESGWRSDLTEAIAATVAGLSERVRFPGGVDPTPVTGAVDDCRGEAAAGAAAELIHGD